MSTTARCWNAFCIAGDCDGVNHVDVTGYTWSQPRGTIYCAACQRYHEAGACDHDSTVVTIYERREQGLASCGHPRNEDGECGCSSWPERAPYIPSDIDGGWNQ